MWNGVQIVIGRQQVYFSCIQTDINRITEPYSDLAIAKTENLPRFLTWSPKVKIILHLSESDTFDSA